MRKSITTALAFIIIASAFGQTASAAQVYTADDLVGLADSLLGKTNLTDSQDINGDGEVNVFDLIEMRKALNETGGELTEKTVQATEKYTKFIGRNYVNDGITWLVHSGSAVEFKVSGKSAQIELAGDDSINSEEKYRPRFAVIVDDEIILDDLMSEKSRTVELFSGTVNRNAVVKVIHLSEANNGAIGVKKITVNSESSTPVSPTPEKDLRIEFIGDSITCAYGVEGENAYENFKTSTENFMKSYAYLTAQKLNAEYSSVSYSGFGIISGYSSDGNKNTDSLVPPIYENIGKYNGYDKPWNFESKPNDVVVINLGTNDSSYTGTDEDKLTDYQNEYTKFLAVIRKNNPDAYIICTLGTMGGEDLYPYIENAVKEYSAESGDKKVSCYKSAVQNSQADGIGSDWHPSAVTQQKSAYVLADKICGVLGIESDQIGLDVAADAAYDIEINKESGANAATYFSDFDKSYWINMVSGGTKSDDICAVVSGIELRKGGKYRLSFNMTTDKGKEIPISIRSKSDKSKIYFSDTFIGDGEKAPFEVEFTSDYSDKESELVFEVGGKDYYNVTLYNLRLEKTG